MTDVVDEAPRVEPSLQLLCTWCKKPFPVNARPLKCRTLACASSYHLHPTCVPLARAQGVTMVCSLCRAPVPHISLDRMPPVAQKILLAFIAGVVPQILADFFWPEQMAKFTTMSIGSRVFMRTVGSWFFALLGLVLFFIFSIVLHYSHRMWNRSLTNIRD